MRPNIVDFISLIYIIFHARKVIRSFSAFSFWTWKQWALKSSKSKYPCNCVFSVCGFKELHVDIWIWVPLAITPECDRLCGSLTFCRKQVIPMEVATWVARTKRCSSYFPIGFVRWWAAARSFRLVKVSGQILGASCSKQPLLEIKWQKLTVAWVTVF